MTKLSEAQLKQHYDQAMKLQAAKQHKEALSHYEKMIAANPRIPEVHFQVARIFTEVGKPERALPHLQAAAALRPAEPAVWRLWAAAVALTAEPEAEATFLAALKLSTLPPAVKLRLQDRFTPGHAYVPSVPDEVRAEVRKIMPLMKAKRFTEAELMAASLLSRNPRCAAAVNLLATAQAKQGKIDAAVANYNKAAALDPEDAEPLNNLGQILIEAGRLPEALEAFRGAVVAAPCMVPALVHLALAMRRSEQVVAALPFALRAARLDPSDPMPLVILGNLYTLRRDFESAEAVLRKALAIAPDRADTQALMAQTLARLGVDQEAMTHFDRALQLQPDLPLAVGGKASLLQTLGRFEEAEPWFRRSLELDPANGETYRGFLVSHKVQPGDPVVDEMIARFNDPKTTDANRVGFGFGIAKALEDLKQYDQVFPYLRVANDLARKVNPYDVKVRHERVAALLRSMDSRDWPGEPVPGASGFGPIFVTGMPRSGTTLVEQIIASHSSVTGAGEMNIAAKLGAKLLAADRETLPLGDLAPGAIVRLGEDYLTQVRQRHPDAARVTDKSIQSYMYLGLLKLAMPKARFVVVRRDPRDNLLSIYKNKFTEGTHLYSNSLRDLGEYYRTFHEVIEFWRARVPDWFYEVQYEELVANPEAETRKLIAACGLDWEDACLNSHQNTRKVDTLSVFQVRQPISKASLNAWQRYESHLGEMFEALGDLLPEDTHAAR
ncbi:tetratricopeptide repeat protein [Frigidibacter albus]|uniref:Tetratricopeptide repeat protein n=1 Tax=Frigidibacter albus TaxID=1465486 RepID=A0A6L8VJR2_9RHOB|nr:tetratricopeptide repeat-containing sulfotransferase family protein [Frigidibacter albus]MZQ90433.1 tetratricopeptide repeat protein [Frigidibacter albus]NBE32447.1 tetratricopeptide repeat protein [Frigidibacter albus]GGH59794.1 sulfotransferase [Frigidibacter albus]